MEINQLVGKLKGNDCSTTAMPFHEDLEFKCWIIFHGVHNPRHYFNYHSFQNALGIKITVLADCP